MDQEYDSSSSQRVQKWTAIANAMKTALDFVDTSKLTIREEIN